MNYFQHNANVGPRAGSAEGIEKRWKNILITRDFLCLPHGFIKYIWWGKIYQNVGLISIIVYEQSINKCPRTNLFQMRIDIHGIHVHRSHLIKKLFYKLYNYL